jgi:cold shock CspA family protein
LNSAVAGERLTGTVVDFDAQVGLGTVEATAGPPLRYRFHCTQIADGTRSVEVGARVVFVAVPAHGGVLEAAGVATV